MATGRSISPNRATIARQTSEVQRSRQLNDSRTTRPPSPSLARDRSASRAASPVLQPVHALEQEPDLRSAGAADVHADSPGSAADVQQQSRESSVRSTWRHELDQGAADAADDNSTIQAGARASSASASPPVEPASDEQPATAPGEANAAGASGQAAASSIGDDQTGLDAGSWQLIAPNAAATSAPEPFEVDEAGIADSLLTTLPQREDPAGHEHSFSQGAASPDRPPERRAELHQSASRQPLARGSGASPAASSQQTAARRHAAAASSSIAPPTAQHKRATFGAVARASTAVAYTRPKRNYAELWKSAIEDVLRQGRHAGRSRFASQVLAATLGRVERCASGHAYRSSAMAFCFYRVSTDMKLCIAGAGGDTGEHWTVRS